MIVAKAPLDTLKKDVTALVADLRRRVDAEPSVHDPLHEEYQAAFDAGRTGRTFMEWSDDRLTQVAVAWVLAMVFVRFGEDNELIPDARLAGAGQRGVEARANQQDFFAAHPNLADRDYLHDVFRRAAALPGLADILGEDASPLWMIDPSADVCTALIERFRAVAGDGALVFDFTDPELSTRFVGDLYQDLSDHARSTYALLQTPVFVEEFILDRTLTPAIDAFGLANTDLIDPTCGSGHFLLGTFDRLTQAWRLAEPGLDDRQIAQRALQAIAGADLNPFAVAIARFRLLVAALKFCRITSLVDAPDFHLNLAVGDSLLWGTGKTIEQGLPGVDAEADAQRVLLYHTEHADDLSRVLGHRYAAVVGNPPYITVKDKALNEAYRQRFHSCSGKYSLSVPFMERFFGLARTADGMGQPAGFVGQITSNSFMKREFGKKLIEQYIPKWDLTHVVDTSGAYIPGHGTPTVILFGRNQRPVVPTIRTVMGIRGEPSTPPDPAKGFVWSAIIGQIDDPGSQSDYVSVADTDRARFANHPWSIGGGGAAELKERIDRGRDSPIGALVDSIGITAFTLEDDVFLVSRAAASTRAINGVRPMVEGEFIRDYSIGACEVAVFPYANDFVPDAPSGPELKHLWRGKTCLTNNKMFGAKTKVEAGLGWYEFGRLTTNKLKTPLSIAFAFVATHNHFVLDRGGKVFNRTAPVIKLAAEATVDDHLRLVGVLNSAVGCFWLKQVCQSKGASTDSQGARVSGSDTWDNSFEHDGTKLQQFPIPTGEPPLALARSLDALATELSANLQAAIAASGTPTRVRLDAARAEVERIRAEMVAAQEELDWWCLHQYGLSEDRLCVPDGETAPPLALGERAFEIILARNVEAGEVDTAWFTRHRSTPITGIPAHWPDWYRDLVQRRIDLIETDVDVALVERPEHKRRWQSELWEKGEAAALRDWLLDRLEDRALWFESGRAVARSTRQLADKVAADPEWMDVARLWAGAADIDAVTAVDQLVADQHVPAQAASRYTATGMPKRAEWERVWDLQRAEDRGEDVGKIAVPPKYAQKDFAKTPYWTQRGKLDVPKERFTSVAGAERDGSMVLAWAGFDHAELAQALATMLHQRQTGDGWSGEQVIPLLVALDEVIPWVAQWHPEVDPNIGQPLADFYGGMVDQALAAAGATRTTLTDWRPAAPTRSRAAKKAASS